MKLLIIEELPALRQQARAMALRALGDTAITTIYEADDGAEALRTFESVRPNVVIMNTVVPRVNGLKIAQYIWTVAPTTKILFWVNQHREFHIKQLKRVIPQQALDGYIMQTADNERLCRAIESLTRFNNTFMDPSLRSISFSSAPGEPQLTEAEQETLGDLLLGLTDKAIAKKRNLTVRGVQNRLASLATKLLGRDRSQMESGIEFYNLRVRMIFEALKRGVYTVEDIPELERNFSCWMETSAQHVYLTR